MDFHKTDNIKTHDQLKSLIKQYKSFIETGEGQPPQFLDEFTQLVPCVDGKTTYKQYTWIDQSLKEIEKEKNKVQAEADLVEEYQSNTEKWRNDKVKPWSLQKLREWIDSTFLKPLEYNLSPDQLIERKTKRHEILEYHNQLIYKNNEDLESAKPNPPSWV